MRYYDFKYFMYCILYSYYTAGASVTAMYTVTLKMVRGEESYIFKGFLKAFKENFQTVYDYLADYGSYRNFYLC